MYYRFHFHNYSILLKFIVIELNVKICIKSAVIIVDQYVKQLDKLMNRFILQSDRFVDYACFPYGLLEYGQTKKLSQKFVYDFEYFAFTKSTKTLKSIRALLKNGHNEDAMILVRSIFENYLSTRYLHEGNDENPLEAFIINPINVAFAFYNISKTGEITNRDKQKVGEILNPSKFKMGKDKKYYSDFYAVLSLYAHCNFGIIDHYKEGGLYSIRKVNDNLLIRFYIVFVFTKLFELVVTVEGEDFPNKRVEKTCYKLVEDSIELQRQIIDALREHYGNNDKEELKHHSKRMRDMLNEMKKSLSEELGSLNKAENKK